MFWIYSNYYFLSLFNIVHLMEQIFIKNRLKNIMHLAFNPHKPTSKILISVIKFFLYSCNKEGASCWHEKLWKELFILLWLMQPRIRKKILFLFTLLIRELLRTWPQALHLISKFNLTFSFTCVNKYCVFLLKLAFFESTHSSAKLLSVFLFALFRENFRLGTKQNKVLIMHASF